MFLPIPKEIGPGGPRTDYEEAINALANNKAIRKYNESKAEWANTTIPAQALSQMAYANAVGPQFVAKLMQDPGFKGNTPSNQLKALTQMITQFGANQSNNNFINNIPALGVGQPSTNTFSGWLKNKYQKLLGQNPTEEGGNPLRNVMPQSAPKNNQMLNNNSRPKGGMELVGEQWYDKNGNPVYTEEIEKPYTKNEAEYLGNRKQGEEAGKYRAKAQQEIAESQLGLSHSGAVLNRMKNIIKNPVFQDMRTKIPFFQDKQLNYLMKTGTPEQKKIIGDFLATAESFIASTVQGFSGKPLVREFDLAQRQKINPSDPIHVAEGKLQSAIALHDIAEQKNEIINDLLDKGINEAEAVKRANKMIDVSEIEKRTEELLRDKPTDEDIKYMAEKYKKTPEEIKKLLIKQGKL